MSAQVRLQKEYISIQKEPVPYALTAPDPHNWLLWHFVIYGISGVFEGGTYYGKIQFPDNYPSSPPSMKVITPNGRFEPNTNICTTMSNYHPEEWSPAWNVRTIITGLISFMYSNENSVGSCRTTDAEKQRLAGLSKKFNLENSEFLDIFGDELEKLYVDTEKNYKKFRKSRVNVWGMIRQNAGPIAFALVLLAIYLKRSSKL